MAHTGLGNKPSSHHYKYRVMDVCITYHINCSICPISVNHHSPVFVSSHLFDDLTVNFISQEFLYTSTSTMIAQWQPPPSTQRTYVSRSVQINAEKKYKKNSDPQERLEKLINQPRFRMMHPTCLQSYLWPCMTWPLTSWPPKFNISCHCPLDHLYQLSSKSVRSFSIKISCSKVM